MIEAVIFDLDGVLVTTDDLHFKAWQSLATSLGITHFTHEDNVRQRGVSRMASLEVVLEKTDKHFTEEEKIELATTKNNLYVASLESITPDDILANVKETILALKAMGIKVAVGSASKNAPLILQKVGLYDLFDGIACGLDTQRSKPDPEVFLIAAEKVATAPEKCLVVEDSEAGIIAAKAGNMKALAVGPAQNVDSADYRFEDLADQQIDWKYIIKTPILDD